MENGLQDNLEKIKQMDMEHTIVYLADRMAIGKTISWLKNYELNRINYGLCMIIQSFYEPIKPF